MDEAIISYDIYEDGIDYDGTASIDLPEITNLVQTIQGAGIGGEYEAVMKGMISAMTMTVNFRNVTAAAIRLAEQRPHTLDLRAAQQVRNAGSATVSVSAIKHVVVATPKSLKLGSLAPASPAGVSGDYAVTYLATYIDGVKLNEVDPLNFICIINGVDALADVRTALGRA